MYLCQQQPSKRIDRDRTSGSTDRTVLLRCDLDHRAGVIFYRLRDDCSQGAFGSGGAATHDESEGALQGVDQCNAVGVMVNCVTSSECARCSAL